MIFRIFGLLIGLACVVLLASSPTRAAEGPSVTVRTVDESTRNGHLTGLKDGELILAGPTTRISLYDVIDIATSGHANPDPVPHGDAHKLNGTVIGTNGSFQNSGNTRDKAFDGKINTYFDPPLDHQIDAWVGLDLGSPKIITEIRYAPRGGFAQRMVDGEFQGSNSPEFDKDVVTFFTITQRPPRGKLSSKDISVPTAFRYVRYTGGSPVSVAEIEFWGQDINASTTKPATQSASTAPTTAPIVVRAVFGEDDLLDGTLLAWDDKQLVLHSSLLQTLLNIPITSVREVWHGPQAQVLQAKAMPLEAGPEDAAFVAKDNNIVIVRGVALGIEGDALRFKFNDQERKINLNRLVGVILGGQESKHDRAFRQKVLFSDGDSLSGQWVGYDTAENVMQLQTPWNQSVSIGFNSVNKIRSANGRLTYLSDLKPSSVEQVPYLDRLMPYRIDHSLTGGSIKLSDGEYQRGIAVHSRCVLTFDLDAAYETFKTKVGFQQPEGRQGDAPIRILGDGKILWEDQHVRGDAAKPAELSLSVAGVKQLTLEVDFGDNGDTDGRIDWANPRLLRSVSPQ